MKIVHNFRLLFSVFFATYEKMGRVCGDVTCDLRDSLVCVVNGITKQNIFFKKKGKRKTLFREDYSNLHLVRKTQVEASCKSQKVFVKRRTTDIFWLLVILTKQKS